LHTLRAAVALETIICPVSMALVAKQPVREQMYTLDVADAKFADDFAAGKMGDLADEAHAVDAARLERGSASNQAGVSAVEGARVQTLSVQRAAGKRAATKLATGVELRGVRKR